MIGGMLGYLTPLYRLRRLKASNDGEMIVFRERDISRTTSLADEEET